MCVCVKIVCAQLVFMQQHYYVCELVLCVYIEVLTCHGNQAAIVYTTHTTCKPQYSLTVAHDTTHKCMCTWMVWCRLVARDMLFTADLLAYAH